ncbi:hypothetical protein LEMLEM_LOCUS7358 [Lemmus lemmus]
MPAWASMAQRDASAYKTPAVRLGGSSAAVGICAPSVGCRWKRGKQRP